MPTTALPPRCITPTLDAGDDILDTTAPVVTTILFRYEDVHCRIRPPLVTYRITSFARDGVDLYLCRMTGSDNSVKTFHLSGDDLMHNLSLVDPHRPMPPLISDYAAALLPWLTAPLAFLC